jgi:hypothetical protein
MGTLPVMSFRVYNHTYLVLASASRWACRTAPPRPFAANASTPMTPMVAGYFALFKKTAQQIRFDQSLRNMANKKRSQCRKAKTSFRNRQICQTLFFLSNSIFFVRLYFKSTSAKLLTRRSLPRSPS